MSEEIVVLQNFCEYEIGDVDFESRYEDGLWGLKV